MLLPVPNVEPPAPNPAKPAVGVFPRRYNPGDVFKDCSVCPEMIVIPAGSFMMGTPASDPTRYNYEGPKHRVAISKSFAVGKFEVTQAEWRSIMGTNPSHFIGDRRPVDQISWNDAQALAERLSTRTGKQYRLLSEAEWEYAARAGTTTPFYTGSTITSDQANFEGYYTSYATRRINQLGTVPVGSFGSNAFGLHDMHGNVWEWVGDCWNKNYHGASTDGSTNKSGDCSHRIMRGGSWNDVIEFMRAAHRQRNDSGVRDNSFGFRLARTLF